MIGDWIELVIGVFVIVAPWIFGFADVPLARWTDILAGLALVLMNLWEIYGGGSSSEGSEGGVSGAGDADPEGEGPKVARTKRARRASVAEFSAKLAPAVRRKKSEPFQ